MIQEHNNIKKAKRGLGDDYKTSCLQGYLYIKKYYKIMAIDVCKQQRIDAKPYSKLILREI